MAIVTLKFQPPTDPDIAALHIYEAAAQGGPFAEIERTTEVGVYPDYIYRYVTNLAESPTDWFTIAWENSEGEISAQTVPLQGGTISLTGEIVDMVLLRDPSINRNVAAEEAAAAISDYYNVIDPNSIDESTVSPRVKSGLANYTLARVYMSRAITSSQTTKWSAGLVSMDSGASSTQSAKAIEGLLDLANRDLGRSYSIILLLKENPVAGGFKRLTGYDVTRSLIEIS